MSDKPYRFVSHLAKDNVYIERNNLFQNINLWADVKRSKKNAASYLIFEIWIGFINVISGKWTFVSEAAPISL